MSEQRTGKASAELFERVIWRRLGATDPSILVGPQHGVDVGVVRVADGVAMALSADPVFVVPAYGWERAAWFAVHILASDAATSGLPLRFMSVDLNLPPEITDDELAALWDAFSRTCDALGIAVITGPMTVSTALVGLIPLMWATGIGADVMKPIAAPLIGGMVSSTVMVLFVIPVLFFWVRSFQHRKLVRREG